MHADSSVSSSWTRNWSPPRSNTMAWYTSLNVSTVLTKPWSSASICFLNRQRSVFFASRFWQWKQVHCSSWEHMQDRVKQLFDGMTQICLQKIVVAKLDIQMTVDEDHLTWKSMLKRTGLYTGNGSDMWPKCPGQNPCDWPQVSHRVFSRAPEKYPRTVYIHLLVQ